MGEQIETLTVDARCETETRVKVSIGASNRWSVPQDVLPRPENSRRSLDEKQKALENSMIKIHEEPFSFQVHRDTNEEALFSTKGHEFIFCDQYIELSSTLPEHPNIYGLGEVNSSFKRLISPDDKEFAPGTVTTFWARDDAVPQHDNVYSSHPFYMEIRDSQAHGVLLLSSNGMDVLLSAGKITYKVLGGNIELYIFTGPTPLDVLKQYVDFIGKPFMPPLWSLGVHQCRWGYKDVDQARSVVDSFKDSQIPLDALWLDIDYMDNHRIFSNDPDRYPKEKLQKLISDLHDKDQHMIVILDPGVKAKDGDNAYEEGKRRDIFIKIKEDGKLRDFVGRVWPGKTCFPDWFHPNTQDYWTQQLKQWCTQFPVDGIWLDMNEISNFADGDCDITAEPTSVEQEQQNKPAEPELLHAIKEEVSSSTEVDATLADDENTFRSTIDSVIEKSPEPPFTVNNPPYLINNAGKKRPLHHRSVAPDAIHHGGIYEYNTHNLYGHMECQATYKSLINIYGSRQKPFILTRSSFVGSGKYTAKWLGDNTSSYTDLKDSIAGMLSMTMFGIPMVGADVGGFHRNCDEQLMLRWTQLATFYPFMRNHNWIYSRGQEFYQWKSVTDLARRCFALRYSLLPYWYTLFYYAATMSTPVLRALSWHHPNDKETLDIDAQYFLGDKLLISPVLQEDVTTIQAYFPPNDIWYDLYTGRPLAGRGWQDIECNVHDLTPVHLRGGSIIPMWNKASETVADTKRHSELELWIGLDSRGQATGSCYLDNDEPLPASSSVFAHFMFENGKFRVTKVQHVGKSETLIISRMILAGIAFTGQAELIHNGHRSTLIPIQEKSKVIINLDGKNIADHDEFSVILL
ncbi:glycosyl hydrolases family 31-domain-containing protein [Umbelopsis sp. AD052]|nr:glycosyl hydrolases family 31-domain-containing protein [Umbelopsis sp. AD052]